MSKLATDDCILQERLEKLDQDVLKRIRKSMLWSMNTWGGERCSDCGLKVLPRCQTDLGGWTENEQGQKTGVFHAYGRACDSRWFFGKCPGENSNWMMEEADRT